MNGQQNEGGGVTLDFSNYAKRREAGLIEWETTPAGEVVMVIKQFNSAMEMVDPLKMRFSSMQVAKLRNERARLVLEKRQQILDIEEEISAIEREDRTLYTRLEADVIAAEGTITEAPSEGEGRVN